MPAPTAATLATAGTEKLRELPMPPWSFGALALGSFLLLLGVLWFFRNTAAQYDTPVGAGHGDPRAQGSHDVQGSHGVQGSHDADDHGAHN